MNSGGAGRTALIYGIAVAGDALATGLMRRGWRVLVADDAPTEAKRALAAGLGTNLVEAPDTEALAELVAAVDIVCPAPGVPETHPVVAAAVAAGTPLRTEIDLAYEFEQQRPGGPRPMLAITGTDGKTTTTLLTAHILEAAGHRASAVGNTDVPLVAALDDDVDVFAVECSSFRLNWLLSFRAEASVWLNLAPDHQNWHTSMASYEAAKARMWAHRRPTDVAIGFADDETVMRNLRAAGGPAHVRRHQRRLPHRQWLPRRAERHHRSRRVHDTHLAPRPHQCAGCCRAGAGERPGHCGRRAGRPRDISPSTTSHRAVGHHWWRAVVQRLEGHLAARRAHGHSRVRPHRAARRWAEQGPRPRQSRERARE